MMTAIVATPAPSPRQPTATPSPRPPGSPTPVPEARLNFLYGRSAAEADRSIVRAAVELTDMYITSVTGQPGPKATVYVFGDLNEVLVIFVPPSALLRPIEVARRIHFTVAEALYGVVLVYTGSDVWRALNDVQRFRVPAHEFFHVLQLERLGRERAESIAATRVDLVNAAGPSWLFEGAAEYVSWLVIHDTGLSSLDAHLAEQSRLARGAPLSLSALETPLGYAAHEDVALTHALIAVHFLLRERGIVDVLRFYEALGRGLPWQQSFAAAFGITVPSFYAAYEELLRSGFE